MLRPDLNGAQLAGNLELFSLMCRSPEIFWRSSGGAACEDSDVCCIPSRFLADFLPGPSENPWKVSGCESLQK